VCYEKCQPGIGFEKKTLVSAAFVIVAQHMYYRAISRYL
jgi:hypothetical protein